MLLIDFRAHPYNRLIMRLKKESKVHKAYEETVKPPPRETMVAAMEDYHNLDVIGGSIVGIAIAQNPELFYQYAHESDVIIKASKITGSDRVDIYKDEIQKALTALETPRVIPRSIIDSVLQRTAVSLNSPSLSEIAEERRDSSFIYPVRAKRPRTLFYLSNTVLTQAYPEIYRDVRDPEVITESSGRYAAAA